MDNRVTLFNYYVEQSKHTEKLWLELTKFYVGLLTALIAAGAFLIERASPDAVVSFVKLEADARE